MEKKISRTTSTLINCAFLTLLWEKATKSVSYTHLYNTALALDKSTFSKSLIYGNLGASHWKLNEFSTAFTYYTKGISELIPTFRLKQIHYNPPAKSIQLIFQKEYLLTLIQDKADTWLDYSKTPIGGKGALQNALKTYALADSMIDFMRYEHVGEGSKLFWRQKTRGMYERAIEASYLAGDTEAAFRLSLIHI